VNVVVDVIVVLGVCVAVGVRDSVDVGRRVFV
jgi:hypothetical protein